MDMLKTTDHLIHEIGFGSLYMSPCINMFEENEHFKLLKSEYDKMLDRLDICLEQKNYKELSAIKNLFKVLKRVHRGRVRNRFCGAAKNMIAIDKNGCIYPCQRFVSNKNYIIGSVKKGIDIDKYNNLMGNEMGLSSREGCNKCWAASLCGGGCPNENLVANGIPNKPIEQYCEIIKYFIENIILRYLKLNKEEKEVIFQDL
ncbi:nif11-like peptide radical SAM maturase [Clostridioides difficile]|nr:nif11-like peptide radical SAM maturase [Clostridioides difficile]